MSEEEMDEAHNTLEHFQDCVITIGRALLANLNTEQRDYVIDKMHDEFRFWRVHE